MSNLIPGKGGGRKKGQPNKITKQAKDAIMEAADALGGADRIVKWAMEDPINERAFWTQIYPKLMPLQVSGNNGGPIESRTILEIVGIASKSRDSE